MEKVRAKKKKKKSIFEEVQLRKKSIAPNDRMPKEYFGIFFFRSFCGKITTIILSRSKKRRNFFFLPNEWFNYEVRLGFFTSKSYLLIIGGASGGDRNGSLFVCS
ncbi:hypothetical protein NH340_JMT05150 [Sarcoptes scabiei]|nr:hypothetical protein NH340_JMT05150 [Sarcoptes scabiei]